MTACIIFNPHAGRRRAKQRIAKYLQQFGQTDLLATTHAGHARELAREASHKGYQQIIAAGGDGTVHEVACGILESNDTNVSLGILPIGSANDFAWSLRKQLGNMTSLRVDVGHVQASDGRSDYFVESIGTGLSGYVTVESRKIGWLQGIPLYALAAFRALLRYRTQSIQIRIDSETYDEKTMLFSVLLGKREGSFVLAPDALNDDGWFDTIHATNLRIWQAMLLIPRIAVAGPPKNHSAIQLGRGKQIHLRSDQELLIHTDGELFAVEGDGVQELTINIIPQRLEVSLLS